MPGRQSHGRSLMPCASGPKAGKKSNSTQSKSRSKSRSKALDAFALAEEAVGPEKTKGLRTRDLEPSPEPQARNKRSRGDDDEDEDEDEDEEDEENDTRMKKRARRAAEDGEEFDDPDMEMEEDSEGNEWHVGVGGDDEDSEIDSDDAFGEEDEAEFEEFAFRGSKSKKSKKARKQEEEDNLDEGDDDDDLESLGSEAIDLATALDQASDSDEEEAGGSQSSGSDEEDDESNSDNSDSDDEDDEDPAARDALKSLISGFAGDEDEDADAAKSMTGQKAKIGLKDLGLFGVKDPHIKKSLKLMNKEEKATKPGASKKLDIPLARRQQDKLLRTAAFEKASETLDRWTDTVKTNRRAEHLFFPLAQNAHDAGLDNGELLPLNPKAAGNELEQTIMAIMEESGLGPSSKQKEQKPQDGEDQEPGLSKAERKELVNQRRRERDLASRELARAKRIKKIKSKAYRRVHRKERLGDEEATLAAMKEAGEIDSEEEKEAQDRRRAMERMGAKHKESRWAKMGAKAGRAVWDDDFRSGLTDMARRDEELRKRIEGRAGDEDDEDDDDVSEASADSATERRRLLRDLDRAATADEAPKSGLMQMKFMQRGEEALRKANDELVEQIRRDLASDVEEEDEDEEQPDVGRRQYGANKSTGEAKPADSSRRVARAAARAAEQKDGFVIDTAPSKSGLSNGLSELQNASLGAAGAWSRAGQAPRKGKKGIKSAPVEELDFSSAAILATTKSVSKPKKSGDVVLADGASSDEEDALHLPMAIRDTELIKRAFAGEDVVGEFQQEKREVADEDDEKEVDNTLPGWGSWVGDGVSKKQKQKHAGRFITKVEGVKKKDRKDWKLERVIVNERRVRKNDKYLASQLPHPFESRLQYERSLRLPVGPEWVTKESFQDATKPRVILKPGVIAPMSKPMV
ncbi:Utp14-domain-containing protein [Coniochaeta ligniaria NRRL 30616]|uniref:Utp14-domain-containing protein n=1 Tax=Coniochaeta ligniaria NRRL 30616 TaxID=1408157 RepID=A0A1J7IBF6_9PEZI|nr:Utp14-domain-containing protein [Coniochaeta ligniaria NRRL 30616]